MTERRTPLTEAHEASGASFTDFGGWRMPVEFDSITAEHEAVRTAAGKFDVSHMGQLVVSGTDATTLCQRLLTNDVTALDPGEALYSAVTDDAGIMLDDVVCYARPASDDYLIVPNAGHDDALSERWRSHRDRWDLDATVTNDTGARAMIAIQGPDAPSLLGEETGVDLGDLGRFDVARGAVAGVDSLVAATGYTGEAGFEIICPWSDAATVWEALSCRPCGLGARDTLRLEMGFLLSGQDFDPADEPRNPYEAGIEFTVKLDTEFVGRDALERVDVEGPAEQLVGLVLVDRGVARHGYAVETPDGEPIGHVTSGTMSPTLGEPIALAYLPAEYAAPDHRVRVLIRGEPKKARTTEPPFIA